MTAAFAPAAEQSPFRDVSASDYYYDAVKWAAEQGITGGTGSAARRQVLLRHLDLPEHLTPNALLEALNLLYTREAFMQTAQTLFSGENA